MDERPVGGRRQREEHPARSRPRDAAGRHRLRRQALRHGRADRRAEGGLPRTRDRGIGSRPAPEPGGAPRARRARARVATPPAARAVPGPTGEAPVSCGRGPGRRSVPACLQA